jgi:hypothetical protein
VGKGNNENLIKKILDQRGCWTECSDSTSTFVNFKWQQDQKGFRYNRLVDTGLYKCALNQFEFHECLCNKEYLFRNLEAYCSVNFDKDFRKMMRMSGKLFHPLSSSMSKMNSACSISKTSLTSILKTTRKR